MSVVVLAEVGGQIWLVQGDEHVDGLLYNSLPDGVTVEWVKCRTRAEVTQMWHERSAAADPDGMPWMLNPLIGDRIRASMGRLEREVRFSPWSAMLDDAAQGALAGAGEWLAANPGGRLVLRQFAAVPSAPGQADLQRLRGQLVLSALVRAGAEAEAVAAEMGTAATDTDAERMEIVTQPPGSA